MDRGTGNSQTLTGAANRAPGADAPPPPAGLRDRYAAVRRQTETLCRPLEIEDYVVSSMPDVSPTKWHLAHTSWFFEQFVLREFAPRYQPVDPRYAYLFNSYYVQAGERHCRAKRGLATRPTVGEVFSYRAHVDDAVREMLEHIAGDLEHPAAPVIELGLQHEQQHQELLLTDIKHVLWTNPLRPRYVEERHRPAPPAPPFAWLDVEEGLYWIGHDGPDFAYDNEGPAHRVFLNRFRMASRLVTNGEYLGFIEAGGYRRPELWLSNGWATVSAGQWQAPLYWDRADGAWTEFTLAGTRLLDPHEPVCHLSYYEADAFARWAGQRLPTEFEWEVAARPFPVQEAFPEVRRFHPAAAARPADRGEPGVASQLYGDVWQWTRSAYLPYPGYRPAPGAIGEYNGKWMCDQWVLRGASCATPRTHPRVTYRNFFPADARWQFTGVRLAV